MPSAELSVRLDEETIDDLLYFARVADVEELKATVTEICKAQNAREVDVLAAAVDGGTGNLCSHYAAANGHIDIIKYITSVGAQSPVTEQIAIFARQNLSGNSPLHWAALNGHLEVVKHIVDSLPKEAQAVLITCKNNAGHDAAFEAESNDKTEIVTYLLGVLDETDSGTMATGASASSRADEFEDDANESVAAGAANADSDAQVEEVEQRLNETELDGNQKT